MTRAVLALRWFRDRARTEALGRDHRVSRAIAHRDVAEAVDVPSKQVPNLPQALEGAMAAGVPLFEGREGEEALINMRVCRRLSAAT